MKIEENEVADIWAKAAAENDADVDGRGYLMDASLSHLASGHINQRRGYKPPKGYKLCGNLEERGRNWLADTASFSGSPGTPRSGLSVGAAPNHLSEGGALGEGSRGLSGPCFRDEERSVRSRAAPLGKGIRRPN